VVAVEGSLLRVERHRDPRAADELVTRPSHLAAVGMEQWQGRSGPREHPHVDPLGRVGEQLPQRRAFLLQPERGVEVPAREMDVRAGGANRLCDPRQAFGAVHERFDAAAPARREGGRGGPAARRGIDRLLRAAPAEPPRMVRTHDPFDGLADDVVDAVQWKWSHGALLPRDAENLTPWSSSSTASSSSRTCRRR